MQTNNNFGAVVGFLLFIVIGVAVLTVIASGTLSPETYSRANRMDAETTIYLEGAKQQLAISAAEMQARIDNAPVLAQLEATRLANSIDQQNRDAELNTGIKTIMAVGFLGWVAAAIIAAVGYAATRSMTVQPPQRTPRSAPPLSAQRPSTGPQQRPVVSPVPQSMATNGHDDTRKREYRQMIEQVHSQVEKTAARVTILETQIDDMSQRMAELQQTVQQYLEETRQLNEGITVRLTKPPHTIHGGNGRGPWTGGNGVNNEDGAAHDTPRTGKHKAA